MACRPPARAPPVLVPFQTARSPPPDSLQDCQVLPTDTQTNVHSQEGAGLYAATTELDCGSCEWGGGRAPSDDQFALPGVPGRKSS